MIIPIVIVASAFLTGLVAGVVALLRAGIRREESLHSLLGCAPTASTAATRRVVGLYVRSPEKAETGPVPSQGPTWRAQWPSAGPRR